MEKIIVIGIVFISIGLLIWKVVKAFRTKDPCFGCSSSSDCNKCYKSKSFTTRNVKNI